MTGSRVRRLADGGERAALGGKGAALARLMAAGCPVPDGFVVTVGALDTDRTAVAAEVRAAYADLGGGPVAVRSSGAAEDGAVVSHAGKYETFLDVTGPDAVVAAVKRCAEPGLAVVVQRMVAADAAGVVFTVDPVTGDPSAITINSGWGVGEGLVGGWVRPDAYTVDRASGRLRGRAVVGWATLTDAHAQALGELALRIEALEQHPVDIEWARVGDELFVLQARPITGMLPELVEGASTGAARLDPWNDSRADDFLWTNTNVGEAIPDVMTPVTWSVVQIYLRDAMATASVPPHLGWGRIGGRVYLNVSVMTALTGAAGLPQRAFRALSAEVFGRLPRDLPIPPVPAGWPARVRSVGPLARHVLGEVRRDRRVVAAYLSAHPGLCDRRRAEIAATDDPVALADLFTHVLEPDFRRVSRMLSASTRSGGAWFVAIRLWLRRLAGDAGADALTSGLGGGSSLASLQLLDGRDHGHRGPHEFELSVPRPAEDPDWVERQRAARVDSGYAERVDVQRQRREQTWSALVRRHPRSASLLRRQLDLWARIARDRERARSELVRYLAVLRAFVLRAGTLTGLGDDVFFLDTAEIVDVLRGGSVPPPVVAERRRAYEGYRALPPYPALIRGRFDPYAWAADPDRRSDVFLPPTCQRGSSFGGRPTLTRRELVRGFPGSVGVVEGVVRVLTDVADGEQLEAGEVLVTTVTNIGWTPLFPRLAALVTDVGAPLSHAAIVARELGLPAVVGCGDATMRLRTGDRVRVDGAAGTVEVLT